MKSRKNQTGFSVFELVILAALAAAVALIGYGVYNRHQTKIDNNSNSAVSSQVAPATVTTAPNISSTSDLTNAQSVLDQNDPGTANSSDSSQLDSQTNDF